MEAAFNKNGRVKYWQTINKDYGISMTKLVEWWKDIIDAIKLFLKWLTNHGVAAFPIALRCYLLTLTELQLGKVWYLAVKVRTMSEEEQVEFTPTQL